MWPFNRGWPLNRGPLNRGSTVVANCLCHDIAGTAEPVQKCVCRIARKLCHAGRLDFIR